LAAKLVELSTQLHIFANGLLNFALPFDFSSGARSRFTKNCLLVLVYRSLRRFTQDIYLALKRCCHLILIVWMKVHPDSGLSGSQPIGLRQLQRI
jgi:hypothetical protein